MKRKYEEKKKKEMKRKYEEKGKKERKEEVFISKLH